MPVRPSRRLRSVIIVPLIMTMCAIPLVISPSAHGAPPRAQTQDTGFAQPFAGPERYLPYAPAKLTSPGQLNRPVGRQAAERIARGLGLTPADALSEKQYRDFVTGSGVGGSKQSAKIIDACLGILTNTNGRPGFGGSILGSYGLYVTKSGMLQSPANASAPTRQVNTLIAPGGYVGNWMRANGARRSLEALYRSAYTAELPFGFFSQQISGEAQLVTNTKNGRTATVGMSMAPPLWLVNFVLLYIVKPDIAAAMPAYWAPIPPAVARAIKASATGQVPYAQYASYFT
ncbi:hypothetical protein [Gordonia sp. NPDC003585]|uniref:hypothetical protein n=1 Tax=Gordonia sp. NPDC003585 TaxID=3154275 RepID=UPI0033AA4C18